MIRIAATIGEMCDCILYKILTCYYVIQGDHLMQNESERQFVIELKRYNVWHYYVYSLEDKMCDGIMYRTEKIQCMKLL